MAKFVERIEQNEKKLIDFFQEHSEIALAYSGGVDSALLLWFGRRYAARFKAYLIESAFQSARAVREAEQLAAEIGADLRKIGLDVLACAEVGRNDAERCYHCKKQLMGHLLQAAREDGFSLIADGSNASDDQADRPGMRALREYRIVSPLRLLGIGKQDVRALARKHGLSVWDKPSDACLATRIPTDQEIKAEDLQRIERAEDCLHELGFRDFRVRLRGGGALLQLPEIQMETALRQREAIGLSLRPYFKFVSLDLTGRISPEEE